MNLDEYYMMEAIKQAKIALKKDEVPIGCVIVKNDKVIAIGHNQRENKQQAIAHAEIIAIEKACKKLGSWRLDDCTLYVTLEPCPMCAGAILLSRIQRVVFGASDPKGGCLGSCINLYEVDGFNHYPEITEGVMAVECGNMISAFFKNKRMEKKKKANTKTAENV